MNYRLTMERVLRGRSGIGGGCGFPFSPCSISSSTGTGGGAYVGGTEFRASLTLLPPNCFLCVTVAGGTNGGCPPFFCECKTLPKAALWDEP